MKSLLSRLINGRERRSILKECQNRWEGLAREDAKYYIWSTEHNQPEEDFRESGLADFNELVRDDAMLASCLPPFGSVDALEIGCGIGRMSEFFSRAFRTLCAIDISSEMIRSAKVRLARQKNIKFKVTDGKSIPFPARSFDFVFSFIVFQHIPSHSIIEEFFHETHRVLRDGGIFKIQLRGRELPAEARTKWYFGVHYGLEEALALAEKTGFEVMRYDGVGERYFWLWLKKRA